ncbi:MAG: ATP-binding protein [Campylobacterota bacterium]|nr:ATP-binding protein [Campylobacterota bacterium]
MSDFTKAKDAFLDVVDEKNYIDLDNSINIYSSLKQAIEKPLKMIMLYGRPGTGKSMLLNRLYTELKHNHNIYNYPTPLVDEDYFLTTLAKDIYNIETDGIKITQFIEIAKESSFETTPIVLLDEAQLYSDKLMEKIRLLSDSRYVKFVITLHKTDEEDIIAKEHFQTRIWESVELHNGTVNDISIYIQKKLLQHSLTNVALMFNIKIFKQIHTLTKGNLRDTNKLLYTLFEIYEYYESHKPSKINLSSINGDYITMSALARGFING